MKPTNTALALASVFALTMLTAPQASAATVVTTWTQADHVSGSVLAPNTPVVNETPLYLYKFQVHNDSYDNAPYGGPIPIIVDWELPYYSDMGITDIYSAGGWNSYIERIGVPNSDRGWSGIADWMTAPAWADSPFRNVTQVIHWYCDGGEGGPPNAGCGIFPGNEVGDFGFYAGFGPTDAPYQSSWDYVFPRRVGDPPFPIQLAPASPCAVGTSQVACNDVPEPGTLSLLGLGLAAALGLGRTRRRKQD